ncbi:MAG: hypothetical protein AB1700_06940 [Bacillota bacterium]
MTEYRCPTASRLLAVALGEVRGTALEEIKRHVHDCGDCRRKWNELLKSLPSSTEFLRGTVPRVVQEAHRPRRCSPDGMVSDEVAPAYSPGEIWRISTIPRRLRRLALLLDLDVTTGLFTAALLSPEVEMASDRDVVLPEAQSPLGYPVLVEAWNQFPVLQVQFVRRFGAIGAELLTAIQRLGLMGEVSQTLTVGSPLCGADDPRADFQLREARAAKELSRLALEEAPCAEEAAPGPVSSGNAVVSYLDEGAGELRQLLLPEVRGNEAHGESILLLQKYIDVHRKSVINAYISGVSIRAQSTEEGMMHLYALGQHPPSHPPLAVFGKEDDKPLVSFSQSGNREAFVHPGVLEEVAIRPVPV